MNTFEPIQNSAAVRINESGQNLQIELNWFLPLSGASQAWPLLFSNPQENKNNENCKITQNNSFAVCPLKKFLAFFTKARIRTHDLQFQ
jgi:hypothetical protein